MKGKIKVKKLKSIGVMVTLSFVVLHCALRAQTEKSGYITVGPDKIYYDMAGIGPVIVFIHDGTIHREVWDDQLSYFSRSYEVVRYDRRGYGKSPAATVSYTNLDDLNALFTQLKIEKACLVGMSAGGRLAVDFTLLYPEKVTSLVLVGAVVGGFPYTSHMADRGGHLPKIDTTDWAKYLQQSRSYYVTEDPYTIFSGNKAAKEKAKRLLLDNPRHLGHARNEPPAAVPAYRRLNEIKVQTLILVGEYDIPDVHAHAGALNAGIMNSRRDIIRHAAHLPPLEQPEVFNKFVSEFLAGTPR